MIIQKKGFLLRDFVIAGMLFGLVVTMFVFQVAGIAENYHNYEIVSPQFSQNYDKLNQNLDYLSTSYSSVKGTGGLNLIGTFNVAFNSVFTVIAMVWNSIAIYTGMAGNLSSDFGFLDAAVVSIFLQAVIGILIASLIFVWLSSVSRGKI